MMNLSVVICVKNEEARLKECLESVYKNHPDEVILVDGGSRDRTVEIAQQFPDLRIIRSDHSNLTRDRQIGIDAALNAYVAMIDADHRLEPSDLATLAKEMQDFGFDVVQSGLLAYSKQGFWAHAEEASWELTHNTPGPRSMIGTAPAIYSKRVFEHVRFDDRITSSIDDTDFIYRLSKVGKFRYGVGNTKIRQLHTSDFKTYVRKFMWYGKGDGEFCHKNPERALSMLFHLAIRYPFLYSMRSIRRGFPRAIPFFVLQGSVRFFALVKYFALRAAR